MFFLLLDAPTATVNLAAGYKMNTLREGDDLRLICNYQSNPEPTSIEWFHNVSFKITVSILKI